MKWTRGYRSDNVEVRRGGGRGGAGVLGLLPLASRFGVGGIVVVVALYFFARSSCGSSVPLLGGGTDPGAPTADDERVQFVSFVFDDAQETWSRLFAERGENYPPAKLVVFHGSTSTGCGYGSAATGPFYCPRDRNVYIDLRFYAQLRERFGAPGDFAQAYVIGHELGHHVQNVLGVFDRHPQRGSGEDSIAVRTELQADCLAGVWAHSTGQRGLLEEGDVQEALRAAAAIGDDNIQRQSGGSVQPESWTHGSAEQRAQWFERGYKRGSIDACDTFADDAL